jgi:hypothetical protein
LLWDFIDTETLNINIINRITATPPMDNPVMASALIFISAPIKPKVIAIKDNIIMIPKRIFLNFDIKSSPK